MNTSATSPAGTDASIPWVTRALGARIGDAEPGAAHHGRSVNDLVILGLRRNRRRAHLLVSTVLGKHIPARPHDIRRAADDLAAEVIAAIGADAARSATVMGFAETATGLGHCVAEAISAEIYLHSTRRRTPGVEVIGTFEEGHSHATTHLLQPTSATQLVPTTPGAPLILVDDEISTGNTATQAIAALHTVEPRDHYVVAALVDMRSHSQRADNQRAATELGVRIDFVSLARGRVELPATLIDEVCALPPGALNPTGEPATSRVVPIGWPADVPDGGRHGFLRSDTAGFDAAVTAGAAELAAYLDPSRPLVVVGHEELMYLPLRLAEQLAARGFNARFQTTTRSPAHVRDEPGYPLRRGFTFTAPESADIDPGVGTAPRFLSNVSVPGENVSVPGEALPQVLLVIDTPADTPALRAPGGVLDVLTAAGHDVIVAVIPATDQHELSRYRRAAITPPLSGPDFGSYASQEVTWLLKDLSHVALEDDLAARERRIQAGTAHYAESLPIEYQPGPAYQQLFSDSLTESADRLATAVGVVSELIVDERHSHPTLVSLARAGTPVGALIRRWLAHTRGIEAPHYTISIVRGRGIDTLALDHIVARHDPHSVVFVDGWTGKGAIQKELTAADEDYARAGGPRLADELAVLADPGSCTTTYGTRDDFLIASACLNSTVSGLVSRTVLNTEHIGSRDFHGAKFYRDLAEFDVSNTLLDTVSARFDVVREAVAEDVANLRTQPRTPDWSGWRSVEQIQAAYGLSSINYVKPGVGETTRVLLRRIPWRVLVRGDGLPEHRHIRVLAAERGVPVEVVTDLAYSCVGLIKEDA